MRGAIGLSANEKDLLNNGDILSITRPEVIGDIHRRFFEAGADICETNTFSATTLAQSEFFVEDPREKGIGRKDPEFFQKVLENPFLQDLAWELNVKSARAVPRMGGPGRGIDRAAALRGRGDWAADGIAEHLAGRERRRVSAW